MASGSAASKGFSAITKHQNVESGGNGNENSGNSGGNGAGNQRVPKNHHRHRTLHHSSAARIRQSHSLNRISELHVADFSSDDFR